MQIVHAMLIGVCVWLVVAFANQRSKGQPPEKTQGFVLRRSEEINDPFANALTHYPFETILEGTKDFEIFDDIVRHKRVKLHFGEDGRTTMDTFLKCLAKQNDYVVVLEVGVWLGHSLVRWMRVSPNIKVIGIDPFLTPRSKNNKKKDRRSFPNPISNNIKNRFGAPCFNRRLTAFNIQRQIPDAASRTILVTGLYPEAIYPLFELEPNLPVHVFYLDGGKVSHNPTDEKWAKYKKFVTSSAESILNHYPSAVISGDDWVTSGLLFQSIIKDITKKYNRRLFIAGNRTWFMVRPQQECIELLEIQN